MFRGERFILNLDDDDDFQHDTSNTDTVDESLPPVAPSSSLGLIGEIRERQPTAAPPPPKPPSGETGFPRHKQRVRQSAFKQRRALGQQSSASVSSSSSTTPASAPTTNLKITLEEEKKAINEENQQRLASLSASQIEEERAELMSSMDPSLLERFLRRAKIDDDDAPVKGKSTETTSKDPSKEEENNQAKDKSQPSNKSVSFDIPKSSSPPSRPRPATSPSTPVNEDLPPLNPPQDLYPASEFPSAASFHFPTPPPRQNPMPNLDPSSPSFLSDLQTHYFPDLPHDPSAVSWLQPPSSDPGDPESSISAYHPASTAVSVSPSAIRFSLVGTILSPSTSLSLPTSLGLHHHGNDPQAAGYTIPELAILSRSSFPAQRCIAWQVLGRILFRLGKGQFGDRGSTLVEGLWSVVEREGVVPGMLAEADGSGSSALSESRRKDQDKDKTEKNDESSSTAVHDTKTKTGGGGVGIGKHASATAWAVEGVWLWQMGGGGDRGLLKDGTIRSQ